ncbi:unnamed protein product [Somion occarium]|uniref:Uncharacterized protein n=1 Tax=Somion occarium TaxID=3059160 RepID=A0ABP1D3I3_9APHY
MNTYTHYPNATFFQYMDVPTGGQRPYAFTTRQLDDLERGVALSSESMSDMLDQKNGQRQRVAKYPTPPPVYLTPEPLPIAAPKPMHPNAISPPLLTLQWKLTGDEFSTPPPSYNQWSPHGLVKETGSLAIASEKNQIIDVGKRAPQPPIGTGRPRPSNIRRKLAFTATSPSTSHSRWVSNERAMALLAILNGHNSPAAVYKPSNQWALDEGRSPYSSYDGPNVNSVSVSSLHAYNQDGHHQSFPIPAFELQAPKHKPISALRVVPPQSHGVQALRPADRMRVGRDSWKSGANEKHNEIMGSMDIINDLSDGLSRDRPIVIYDTPRPVQQAKRARPLPRPPIQAEISPFIMAFSSLRV